MAALGLAFVGITCLIFLLNRSAAKAQTALRPGIFPADTTIFTGKISKKRMIEEHELEYAEITGTAEVEKAVPEVEASPAAGAE